MQVLVLEALGMGRRLLLGYGLVDDVFPGFRPGDFGVLLGNEAFNVGFSLCVRSVTPMDRGGLGSEAVFIDGGNIFNPYVAADVARSLGLDPSFVLERIYVSRAFTVHQLSALVLERLEGFLGQCRAGLVYVSDICRLFMDRGVSEAEARSLFLKVCSRLSEVAERHGLIVLASYTPHKRRRRSVFFEAALLGRANVSVKADRRGSIFRFTLLKHSRLRAQDAGSASKKAAQL